MIDLLKAKFTNKNKIENKLLLNTEKYAVEKTHFYAFPEKKYPIRSSVENFFINITKSGATIENSLHKYFNKLVSDEKQNHNDFHYYDIEYALDVLEDEIGYPLEDTSVTRLEFGFNIKLNICPTNFLRKHLLMYKLKTACFNPKNNTSMKIQKFIYNEYEFKIYNKTVEQSRNEKFKKKLQDSNILRIEIKHKSRKNLNKLGIYTLSDLRKKSIYFNLMKDFMTKYNELLIVDSYKGSPWMNKKETRFFKDCMIDQYWNELKEDRSINIPRNHKKRLEKLIKKYELDTWKKELKKNILNKFNELMP